MNEVVLGGVMGLAGVVLGYMLQWVTEALKEKKADKAEFNEVYSTIYHSRNVGDWYSNLSLLRKFFLRHPEYLKKEANKAFFDKWLTDIAVEDSMAGGSNAWTQERITDLFTDLEKLKV